MAMWLKQSTAVTVKIGPFIDQTDGYSAETALTIAQGDVRLSKNGGDIAQKSDTGSCTHDEIGVYNCSLNTTDTGTLGRLQLWVHESGALPVWHEFMVVPANVWDSMFGSDKLQVHTDEMTAGVITASVVGTGAIDADALAADAVDEIFDELAETNLSLREFIRLGAAVLFGKSSGGGGSTIYFRDVNDTKNRITATVDSSGNRTAVTRDDT